MERLGQLGVDSCPVLGLAGRAAKLCRLGRADCALCQSAFTLWEGPMARRFRHPQSMHLAIALVVAAPLVCNFPPIGFGPSPTLTQLTLATAFLLPSATPPTVRISEVPAATQEESPSPTSFHLSSGNDYPLGANQCFDLDNEVEVPCSATSADFQFVVEETPTTAAWSIVPVGPTLLRSLGFQYESTEPPAKSLCSGASLGSQQLDLLPMAEIFWNCFQTSEGHLGWLKAQSWVPGTLTFSWATYSAPP